MTCRANHTKYQPTEVDWYCPHCGNNKKGEWVIYDVEESALDGCELLHKSDVMYCEKCFFSCTGNQWAIKLQKLKNLIACPHCKGTGLVKKDSKS